MLPRVLPFVPLPPVFGTLFQPSCRQPATVFSLLLQSHLGLLCLHPSIVSHRSTFIDTHTTHPLLLLVFSPVFIASSSSSGSTLQPYTTAANAPLPPPPRPKSVVTSRPLPKPKPGPAPAAVPVLLPPMPPTKPNIRSSEPTRATKRGARATNPSKGSFNHSNTGPPPNRKVHSTLGWTTTVVNLGISSTTNGTTPVAAVTTPRRHPPRVRNWRTPFKGTKPTSSTPCPVPARPTRRGLNWPLTCERVICTPLHATWPNMLVCWRSAKPSTTARPFVNPETRTFPCARVGCTTTPVGRNSKVRILETSS
jgi:hypothetical protein